MVVVTSLKIDAGELEQAKQVCRELSATRREPVSLANVVRELLRGFVAAHKSNSENSN